MRKERLVETILSTVFIIVFVIVLVFMASGSVSAKSNGLKMIEATAYYDSYGHGCGADGRKLIEGLTIAGRRQDLGKTAILYDGEYHLIGIYEFRDTGYGRPTGKGKSKILKGRTLGDIETGQTVDIYFSSKQKCEEWGRRKVYIQIINARG